MLQRPGLGGVSDGCRSAVILDVGVKAAQAVRAGELQGERRVHRRALQRALWSSGEVLGGRLRCDPRCGDLVRLLPEVGMDEAHVGKLAA